MFALAGTIAACSLGCIPSQAQWTPVGGVQGISTGSSNFPSLVRDNAGNLYVAYHDSTVAKGNVQRYNGSNWSYLGSSNGITGGGTMYNSLAVNAANELYYAYHDQSSGNRITVQQYTGSSWTGNWQNVSTGQAYFNSMKTTSSGYPVQVSRDINVNSNLIAKRYDGNGWSRLGNAGFAMLLTYYPSLVYSSSDTVYVASVSPFGAIQVHQIHAQADSLTAWQSTGATGFAATNTTSIFQAQLSLAIDASDRLYMAYVSAAAEGAKLKVKKYENGIWSSVGADNFTAGTASFVSIAVTPSGTPYVAFSDGSQGGKTTIMTYDGAQWTVVGTAGISSGTASHHSLLVDAAGNPVVAFVDAGNGYKTTVMRYQPPCTGDPGPVTGSTGCVTFNYNGSNVTYTTVRGADGNIWLQQNLGSTQVATSATDTNAYGDTFQWGRWDDGHQKRNAATGPTPAVNNPSGLGTGSNTFYTGSPSWWTGGALSDTWTAVNAGSSSSTNDCDPCKALGPDWHLPTQQEWAAAIDSENINSPAQAYNSHLKLITGGNRNSSGNFDFVGTRGYYWSSTSSSTGGKYLYYSAAITNPNAGGLRGQGMSIRCLKTPPAPVTDSVRVSTLNNVPAAINTNGGSLQMTATVFPLSMNQNVTWSVIAGTGTATISAGGLVTAQSNGTVWAKATAVSDTTRTDSMQISISNQVIPIDSIRVRVQNNAAPLITTFQGSLQLIATVYPASANQDVSWSVLPLTGNATVNASGLVTAASNGTVRVRAVSVQDVTKKDSIQVTISNQTTGIEEALGTDGLIIYPNPAKDKLHVTIPASRYISTLRVVDVYGRTRRSVSTGNMRKIEIDLSALPAGWYLLLPTGGNSDGAARFLKED